MQLIRLATRTCTILKNIFFCLRPISTSGDQQSKKLAQYFLTSFGAARCTRNGKKYGQPLLVIEQQDCVRDRNLDIIHKGYSLVKTAALPLPFGRKITHNVLHIPLITVVPVEQFDEIDISELEEDWQYIAEYELWIIVHDHRLTTLAHSHALSFKDEYPQQSLLLLGYSSYQIYI